MSMLIFSETREHNPLYDIRCNYQKTDIDPRGPHISSRFALTRDVIRHEKPRILPVRFFSYLFCKVSWGQFGVSDCRRRFPDDCNFWTMN